MLFHAYKGDMHDVDEVKKDCSKRAAPSSSPKTRGAEGMNFPRGGATFLRQSPVRNAIFSGFLFLRSYLREPALVLSTSAFRLVCSAAFSNS